VDRFVQLVCVSSHNYDDKEKNTAGCITIQHMHEELVTNCPICGATHSESAHLESLPIERRREDEMNFSVQDAVLAITGNPIRLESEADIFDDTDTRPRAYITTRGKLYFDHKNREWLDTRGNNVAYPHAVEHYLRFERLVNEIIKKRLPESYNLLDIREWSYYRGDSSTPNDPRLAAIYQSLLERLRRLPAPQLVELAGWGMEEERDRTKLLSAIEEYFPDRVSTISAGHKDRGSQVYLVASFLQGRLISQDNLEENIEKALRGKRLLILGDDLGTLSEVLRAFGAEAYGIDSDQKAAMFARSGLFAENLKPQRQLIEGDIRTLINPASALNEKVKKLGPFDMVYSRTVLPYIGLYGLTSWYRLMQCLDELTIPQGLNIHGDCHGSLTASDKAKSLLYDIESNPNDPRHMWARERYAEMSHEYAATSLIFVLRHGAERRAHEILKELESTPGEDP